MARQPYYGPAGIFSTDDVVADRRQIACEQYEEDEGEDPGEDVYVYGSCRQCRFLEEDVRRGGDFASQRAIEKYMREQHQTEYPNCPGRLAFS